MLVHPPLVGQVVLPVQPELLGQVVLPVQPELLGQVAKPGQPAESELHPEWLPQVPLLPHTIKLEQLESGLHPIEWLAQPLLALQPAASLGQLPPQPTPPASLAQPPPPPPLLALSLAQPPPLLASVEQVGVGVPAARLREVRPVAASNLLLKRLGLPEGLLGVLGVPDSEFTVMLASFRTWMKQLPPAPFAMFA